MIRSDLTRVSGQPSDAPLKSEKVRLPDGRLALLRELDEPWAHDDRAREALLREVQIAAMLPDSSLLQPLLAAQEQPVPWLARAYGEAGTLADRICEDRPLDGEEIAAAGATAFEALEVLRAAGIVHGDPSPSNLLRTEGGGLRLADPGSARRAFGDGWSGESRTPTYESDLRRVMSWLLPLAERAVKPDPVASELLAILRSGRGTEDIAPAVRTLGATQGAPLAAAMPARTFAPARTRVFVGLASVDEPRERYRIAKLWAARTGEPAARVRERLERGPVGQDALFPEPARTLLSRMRESGIPAEILRPIAKEGGKAASPPPVAKARPWYWALLPVVGTLEAARRLRVAGNLLMEEGSPTRLRVAAREAGLSLTITVLQLAAIQMLAGLLYFLALRPAR